MILVEQLMRRDLLKVGSQTTVLDAAVMMKANQVGYVVVEDDGSLQGIVTETDIVRKVVSRDLAPGKMSVEEIMNSPVITIDCKRPVTDADELMDHHRIRHLVVTEGDRVVGMLSVRDLLHTVDEEEVA